MLLIGKNKERLGCSYSVDLLTDPLNGQNRESCSPRYFVPKVLLKETQIMLKKLVKMKKSDTFKGFFCGLDYSPRNGTGTTGKYAELRKQENICKLAFYPLFHGRYMVL